MRKKIEVLLLAAAALGTSLLLVGCDGDAGFGYYGPYVGGYGPYGVGDYVVVGGAHYHHYYGYHHFYPQHWSGTHFHAGGFHGGFHR